MIKSVNDIYDTGDAIEFVEDNMEFLQRIEDAIHRLWANAATEYEYEFLAQFLEAM